MAADYFSLAHHDGYCVSCDTEQPLVVMERGARGLRAWLSGISHADRTLSYTCLVCGRVEHVPLTEAEDLEYAATLPTWPDWNPVLQPVAAVVAEPILVAADDVYALAAQRVATARETVDLTVPAQRRAVVRIVTLPVQRVQATDGQLLALAVA
jgi:hypothetical protein